MRDTNDTWTVEEHKRHPYSEQRYRVVSERERKENEWRKDWYHPSVDGSGLSKERADLIGAAPDLFRACERAVEMLLERGASESCNSVRELRAAITKARGT
jgi:hypothetical protein